MRRNRMKWFEILIIIFWIWMIVDSFLTDIVLKKLNKRLDNLEKEEK
jgi:hypothetical protein